MCARLQMWTMQSEPLCTAIPKLYGAVAALNSSENCCAKVLATSRRKESLAFKPLILPLVLRKAVNKHILIASAICVGTFACASSCAMSASPSPVASSPRLPSSARSACLPNQGSIRAVRCGGSPRTCSGQAQLSLGGNSWRPRRLGAIPLRVAVRDFEALPKCRVFREPAQLTASCVLHE